MTGNTQAQAEKTATAVPEKQGTDVPTPTLENASLEEMDAVQTAALTQAAKPEAADSKGEPVKPTEEKPAAEEPAKVELVAVEEPAKAEAPTEPAQPAEPVKPAEPTETGELPERFRFKNPTDKAIAAVYKAAEAAGSKITWAEAEKRVVGETPPAQAETTLVDPLVAAEGTIETLTGEIAELEKQIDPENEEEILSTKEQRKATVRLSQARAELTEAKLELRDAQGAVEYQRQTVAQRQAAARKESTDRAIADYPDAATGDTALGAAIAKRFAEMKNPQHPEHPILYADTAPERVAQIVARELGIAPKPKTVTPPTTPAAQPVKATPVSGAKTAVAEKPAEGTKDKKSVEYLKSDDASLEELDGAFNAHAGIAAAVR